MIAYQPPRPARGEARYTLNLPTPNFSRPQRTYRTFAHLRRVLTDYQVSPRALTQAYLTLHETGTARVFVPRTQQEHVLTWNKVIYLTQPQFMLMLAALEYFRNKGDEPLTQHTVVGEGTMTEYLHAVRGDLLRFANPRFSRIKQHIPVVPTPRGEAILRVWLAGDKPSQNVHIPGFSPL